MGRQPHDLFGLGDHELTIIGHGFGNGNAGQHASASPCEAIQAVPTELDLQLPCLDRKIRMRRQ